MTMDDNIPLSFEEPSASARPASQSLDQGADCGDTEEAAAPPPVPLATPALYIAGKAGSGKTFHCKAKIAEDPHWGILAATTGIAAVNLDATTVNSLLGYFDTDSLRDAYLNGRLIRRLHELALDHRNLVIDEVSMMDAAQLDMLWRALQEANAYKDVRTPMGLVLVGDFAQLPPIKARWAFEADCWPLFAASTLRLDKIWRQDEAQFLAALNAARRGEGEHAAQLLTEVGVEWHTALDVEFDGTTIIPKNDAVDRYNQMALDRVRGERITVASRRWGKQRGEWKNVPERLELKVGAYVMLLANHPEFEFVNGDCGHVIRYAPERWETGYGTPVLVPAAFEVELARNGATVRIPRLVRDVGGRDKPDGWAGPTVEATREGAEYVPKAHYRKGARRYVVGQCEYFPIRLAYASTVHKSQGLSLDRCQIDFRDFFFSNPAMLYTALSRCRTLGGLRLVGQRERFIKQCKCDPRVREWL